MGAAASDLEVSSEDGDGASAAKPKLRIATLTSEDFACLENLDIMKLLMSPSDSMRAEIPFLADSAAGHPADGGSKPTLLRSAMKSVSLTTLKGIGDDIYDAMPPSLKVRRMMSRPRSRRQLFPAPMSKAKPKVMPSAIGTDDTKLDLTKKKKTIKKVTSSRGVALVRQSTTPRMARSSSIPDLRSTRSALFKETPSDTFHCSAHTFRREEYLRSLLTNYSSDEELASDFSDDDDEDVRKREAGVRVSPLERLKSVAYLDDDLRSAIIRRRALELAGDSETGEHLKARTKCVLMKLSAATVSINVIGVLFGEDSTAALPLLQSLSPRSLKLTMESMAQAESTEIDSLFSFDSPEWLVSETSARALLPTELKKIQGAFWDGVYVSAVLQTSASAPWLKPKSKRMARKKAVEVWVSDKQKTECFDSFDSELIFMDSIMRFRIPPFKTAADSTTIGKGSRATLNGLHPQIAFNCFESQSAEAPGSVLLRVKQLRAKKSRGSEDLGVAMLYVRDLFETVSVAPKSEHSEVHLFQLPLFEAVDNARVKAIPLLMAKEGVSTADALLRQAAHDSSAFNEDIVKKPAAKGVLVCSVQFAWD